MKKTIAMIALAALFVSCAKEAEQTPATAGEVITVAPTEFHATLETPEPDTRTTLGGENGKKVLWEEGDAISVWSGVLAQAKYTLSSGESTTSATFTSSQTVTGSPLLVNCALYPYDKDVVLTESGVLKNIKYPEVQNYRANTWYKGAMLMLGESESVEDKALSFHNLAGVLRLTLRGTATIDSIRVSALDAAEYVSGAFDASREGIIFTSGKKTVTLKCPASGVGLLARGTVFNIVIPPIKGGFKVEIFAKNHGLMILQSNSEIKRNTILNMPAREYAPNAMDLGLSVYWATCNVGATTPEGYGDYFAWGETETYYKAGHAYDNPCTDWKAGKNSGYAWGSYSLTSDGGSAFSKYNDTDNKYVLEAKDDVASAKWGSVWRMPTITEFEELYYCCEWTWTTKNGVSGYNVVSYEAGSNAAIFLPAAGNRVDGDLNDVVYCGFYWSSSLGNTSSSARILDFYDSYVNRSNSYLRHYGMPVRPVTE